MNETTRTLLALLILVLAGAFVFGFSEITPNKSVYQNRSPSDTETTGGSEVLVENPTTTDSVVVPQSQNEKSDQTDDEDNAPDTPEAPKDTEEETTPTIPSIEEVLTSITIPIDTFTPQKKPDLLLGFSSVNEQTRASVVNILCTTRSGGVLNPITGSGILIDARGVILTNSHIAQYFLLKDYPTPNSVNCIIRSGSPARNMYEAELLYLPTSWISNNRTAIRVENPTGTGEDDYALLRITGGIGTVEAPGEFPFVPLDLESSRSIEGGDVLIVSYPAGLLGGSTILQNLHVVSANSKIFEVFTFGGNTKDLISTGGSVVAQKGSSGGAVVSVLGGLQGIVVTSTAGETTDTRDLRAITTSHINRSIQKLSGFGLIDILSNNIELEATAFNETVAPTLTNILVNELQKITAP